MSSMVRVNVKVMRFYIKKNNFPINWRLDKASITREIVKSRNARNRSRIILLQTWQLINQQGM